MGVGDVHRRDMGELKKVEVIWNDAGYEAGEITESQIKSLHPIPRRHVGYLMRGDDSEVIFSCGITERSKASDEPDAQDTFELTFALPRGIIKEIKILDAIT